MALVLGRRLPIGQSNAHASFDLFSKICTHLCRVESGRSDATGPNLTLRIPGEIVGAMKTKHQYEIRLTGTQTSSLRGHAFALLPHVLVFLYLANALGGRAQENLSEYQVKAAYLFNFLKFVEWPKDAFTDPLAPIVIGVVGKDPFGDALPQVVIGKTVQGRDLVIRIYHAGEDLRGAHILFISSSERKRIPAILSSLRGSCVLTVADTTGFLEAEGMIQFLTENDRVRFAINVDATNQAKLKVSSKLLSLAKVMGGSGKEAGN